MGVTKRDVLLFVSVGLWACQGSNDMVLQPDTAATSGTGAAGAGTGGGTTAGASGSVSSGTAGSAGKPPAAGSGTGAAGTASTTAGAGAAGKAGTGASGTGGTSGGTAGAGGTSAAGTGGGESGTGASGEGGGGAGGEPAMGAADPMCDFNGIWIAKQATVSEAIGIAATSNNWYYLEFKQSGTNVEVSKHYDCGIEVTGVVTVKVSRATLEALLTHNVQTGRKATLVKDGTKCKFESARFWSIRGGDEARFLPNPARDSMESIKTIAMQNPLPTRQMPDGSMDLESDGKPGVAFQVTGIISGTRNSVQRDWTKWFTDTGFEITASADWKDELKIRADFDNEESILDPADGPLISGSTPRAGAKHTMRLRFLGRDASDPRVAEIVKGNQVDTCFAIQDAFPAETLE